ncbi:MAG: glucose-6-phosphate isomerase family protein [Candidatus Hydrothermarchaeales archaeon]
MTAIRRGNLEAKPQIRMLYDMSEVLYDKEYLKSTGNQELYYMYRDLYLSRPDKETLRERGLRYDITVIPPRMLGAEFVKTAGHYHPLVPGTGVTYPELYEVLAGTAHFLLQKPEAGKEEERIIEAVVIEAEKGDKAIIPPGYGHVTINPSNNTLKMANFVARDFSSIYEPYKRMGGAAYYKLHDSFIKNRSYEAVPELRRLEPTNLSELGLKKGEEMYGLIRKDPALFDYLTHPQEYDELFERIIPITN